MGKALVDFGLQMAQQGAGMLMGKWAADQADKRQLNMQRHLTDMQFDANRRLMDISQQKQYEMWLKTNYPAQKEQLEKAGLNPGLMYGMSGGGGATTGSAGASVSGGNAPSGGGEITGMGIASAQLGLLKAQKENIEANTAKTRAEAENLPLTGENIQTDTGLKRTQILDLTVGVDNKRAETKLKEIQARLGEIAEQLQGRTLEDSIRAIGWAAEKTMQEMEGLRYETNIKEDTWKDKVSQVKADLLGTWIRNALTQKQITKTDAEIQAINQTVKNMARDYVLKGMSWETQQQGANTQTAAQQQDQFINDLQKSTGIPMEILREAVDGVFRKGR